MPEKSDIFCYLHAYVYPVIIIDVQRLLVNWSVVKQYGTRTCFVAPFCFLHLHNAYLFDAVLPDFAQVYGFIGSVFDPDASNHLQKLKKMDPIDVETVCLRSFNKLLCVSWLSRVFLSKHLRFDC